MSQRCRELTPVIVDLYTNGQRTFREIGLALGVSPSGAAKAYRAAGGKARPTGVRRTVLRKRGQIEATVDGEPVDQVSRECCELCGILFSEIGESLDSVRCSDCRERYDTAPAIEIIASPAEHTQNGREQYALTLKPTGAIIEV